MINSRIHVYPTLNSDFFFSLKVENGKKTLILHGTKTSAVLNSVLTEIHHLKKENSIKYSRRNEDIRPFENGGETSLEFFSQKTDCSMFVVSETFCVLFTFSFCSCHYFF